MRKSFFLPVIAFTIVLFTNCTTPKALVINVQKPAEVMLSGNINNVIITNNLVTQPEFIGQTTQKYKGKGKPDLEEVTVSTDSLGIILSESVYDKLISLNHFKEVSIYDQPLREDLSYLETRPIDSLTAKEVCNISNSDAIISLDRFLVQSNLKEDVDDIGTRAKILDLKMSAAFSIYSKEGVQISPSLSMSDSIYWTELYYNNHLVSEDTLPGREESLKIAAEYMGEKIATALVPYWKEEVRQYFNECKDAIKLTESEKWDEARLIWETAYNTEIKDKRKARLASNIALSYELTDNLVEAIKWITLASDLFEKSAQTSIDIQNYEWAKEYKSELLQRFNEFKMLDKYKPSQD